MRAISLAFVRASSARARVPFYFLTSKCLELYLYVHARCNGQSDLYAVRREKENAGAEETRITEDYASDAVVRARAPANCMLRRANKSHGYTHPCRYVHTSSKSALEEAFGFFVLLRLSLLLLFFLFSKCRQRERRGERSVKIT